MQTELPRLNSSTSLPEPLKSIVAWHRSRPGHVIPAMQQEAAGHMDVALGELDGDEAGESDAD